MTDYLMPRMNGLQLARAMQSVRPGVPIALLSGFIGEFTSAELASGGILQLLQKPASGSELAQAASTCVSAKRRLEAAEHHRFGGASGDSPA